MRLQFYPSVYFKLDHKRRSESNVKFQKYVNYRSVQKRAPTLNYKHIIHTNLTTEQNSRDRSSYFKIHFIFKSAPLYLNSDLTPTFLYDRIRGLLKKLSTSYIFTST